MKAITKLSIVSLFVIAGLSSCTDYLNVVPDNIATIDNAFSDKYTAEKYLFTCYSFLPSFGDAWSNPALLSGDEIWYPERLEYNGGIRIAKGEQTATNPVYDRWAQNYLAIRTCNTFLEKVDGVKDLYEYERVRWVAEVKFLKAYYHYTLIRMYGPMHIMDVSTPVSATIDDIKVERDPVDDCFDYVVDLLDEAIDDLPLQIEMLSTELGRITKPIAVSIKARVLMTAASPLFNGNPDYATFVSKSNVSLFNSSYDETKWEKAALACKAAIDISEEAGYGMFEMADYITSFQNNDSLTMKLFLRSRISERWNKEIIWAATSGIAGGIQSEATPRFYPALFNPVASRHAPTLRMAEEYYSKNGVPINEDIEWDYANRYSLSTGTEDHKYYIGEGEQTASLNFNREYRFYADLSHDRALWFGNGKLVDDEDSWIIKNLKGEYSSVFEVSQYSVTGYWAKKLVHIENEIRNGSSYFSISYAFPVVRMADLYLYYSEALNEIKSAPDAEVYEYIDAVRARAGLNGVVDSWASFSSNALKPTTKSGMREIIQKERLIEMSFEGARFWDLRRWKLSQEYLNGPIRGWSVLKDDPREYYRVNTLHSQSFKLRDYFWPIRENELVNNPSLTQNPGW